MSKARSIAIVSLVMAALVVPAAVSRSAADPGPGRGHWLQKHLGLTDDQARQMREMRQRDAEAHRDLGRQLAEAQTALRQLALSGGDQAAIDAKAADVQRLLGEAVRLRVKSFQEMAPLLTPEQREKLAQMPMERWGAHGHRQRGRPGQPGQPGQPAQPGR